MSSSCCSVTMCESPDCLQLTEREARVCSMVCASAEPMAFSTIKENLGFHQEIVSRILKRLVNYGAVRKVEGRYRRVGQ